MKDGEVHRLGGLEHHGLERFGAGLASNMLISSGSPWVSGQSSRRERGVQSYYGQICGGVVVGES